MKRNTKGFTLIELLAVIVVLAIIALIATPIVLNLINTARRGAAESSATAYVKGVENAVLSTMVQNTDSVICASYDVKDKTITCTDATEKEKVGGVLTVDVDGTVPESGKINFTDRSVSDATFKIGSYDITYKDGKSTAAK